MRDGVRLAIDVYRPDGQGPFPVLYAAALHNKDMQGPDMADVLPPQPANVPLWFGPIEAGDTRRLIANGYVHVIAQPRGSAKSEGHYGIENTDHYDVIEWISRQPWCDGNVGMVGISGYAGEQWRAAAQGHPALKAIFPYDACSAYGGMFGFRDFYPGGVLHTFPYLLDVFSTVHEHRDVPGELPPEEEKLFAAAMANPDFKMYANLYNILTQKGKRTFIMYHSMVAPVGAGWDRRGRGRNLQEDQDPVLYGIGRLCLYLQAALARGAALLSECEEAPRKLLFTGPAHLERPFHEYHDEIIRWYDHWLKGIDNGIMDEPPVRYWLMGANEWRTGTDWPLPETQWRKLYLSNWERLTSSPPRPADRNRAGRPRAGRLHADAAQEDHEGRAAPLHDRTAR